jgi:hypothetical protein
VRPPQELFTPPGVDPFALYVTSPLVLEARFDVVERVSITGTEPSESNEARSALREGKLPAKLKLEIVRGERDWACTLDGDTLSLSAVRLPAELKKEEEAALEERLYLMAELEGMLDALLQQYVELRLSKRFRQHGAAGHARVDPVRHRVSKPAPELAQRCCARNASIAPYSRNELSVGRAGSL